jgi:hypothetical protein
VGPLLVFLAVVAIVILVGARSLRRRGASRPGAGTVGTVYDLLNEDKRNAVEIILEERAEARDPERATGNLPDLERPKRPPS